MKIVLKYFVILFDKKVLYILLPKIINKNSTNLKASANSKAKLVLDF